jgi:F-type H+-transporting ATPase subunit gamma
VAGGQEKVLRRRIRTVQSTKKITRAFELIAASQIVRAQNRLTGFRPYLKGIAQILTEAAADAGHAAGRVLGVPESPEHVLVLAVVADRGLCGAYNANVLRLAERTVRGLEAQSVDNKLMSIGRKAQSYFRFRRIPLEQSFSGFSDRPTFEDARRVAAVITPLFLAEEVDQVLIVSTRFVSAGTQVVETRQLLPLPEPTGEDGEEDEQPRREGYTEFEPESPELLVELVPRYVEAALFGALLEAAASEHTARQRAMAAASENADELAKTLTRDMNRARQDAITTEIMEIVGGAEALRQAAHAKNE